MVQRSFEPRYSTSDFIALLSNPSHRLRRKKEVEIRNLENERWALMSRPRSIVEMFRAVAASRGLESPRISVETNSLDLLKSLVTRGSFLTALPRGAMRAELEDGQAATLAVRDLPALATGFLHRQEVLPPAVALLLDEVSSSLRSF